MTLEVGMIQAHRCPGIALRTTETGPTYYAKCSCGWSDLQATREQVVVNLNAHVKWAAEAVRACDMCGATTDEWYSADNNASGEMLTYCGECDDQRADRHGCVRILAEGCSVEGCPECSPDEDEIPAGGCGLEYCGECYPEEEAK